MRLPIVIVLLVAAAFGTNATAQNSQVKKWPDDVPCDAVKKNPDGSYTQLIDLMMGSMPMPTKTYTRDSAETRSWERKCGSKTG